MISKREAFWLLLVFLLSLFLRLYRLPELMTFTYDQGRDMYVLQELARGHFTLIGPTTGLPGVFIGPFMYYLLLPGFILSNGSPIGTLVWLILLFTSSLVLFYFILKPLVGSKKAYLGYLLLNLTPGSINQTRSIWNPTLVVPTLLLTFFSWQMSKTRPWWLVAMALFYGLSLQTELAYTFFLAPVLAGWVLFNSPIRIWLEQLLKKKKNTKKKHAEPLYSWKILLVSGLAFGLTLAPQLVFELRHDLIMTKSFIRETHDPHKQVSLLKVWRERPEQMAHEIGKSLINSLPYPELIAIALGIMAVFGLLAKKNSVDHTFWSALWLMPLVGLMTQHGNYGYFFDYYLTSHYMISLAVLLFTLTYFKARLWPYILIFVIAAASFITLIQTNYNPDKLGYTLNLQLQALQKARQLTSDAAALEVFVPNLLPVNYQYLSEWLSRTHQARPMPFGVTTEKEYALLYEPTDYAPDKTFYPWMDKFHQGATCTDKQQFGIIFVEKCIRAS